MRRTPPALTLIASVALAALLLLLLIGAGSRCWLWAVPLAAVCATWAAASWLLWRVPSAPYVESASRAVLITGCDSGFGFDLCKRLDDLGYVVFAAVLLPHGAGAAELRGSSSPNVVVLGLDVTKDEQVAALLRDVDEELRRRPGVSLWAVVNNAGISGIAAAEWCPMSEFESMMNVNAFGAVRVSRAFLPHLRASRGRLVTVTSSACQLHWPYLSAYSMSKSALAAFCNCLRREMMRFGVKVIVIEPSAFRTNMSLPKNMQRRTSDAWEHSSATVRRAYGGQPYIEKFCKFLERGETMLDNRLNLVVDCMADAVASSSPHLRYTPLVGKRLFFDLLSALPLSVVDAMVALKGFK